MSNGFISIPIRRPVLTTVIYIIVIVIGIFSLWRLPIDLMPEITYPSITVVTNYGNAGPQEMEELITKPIESALAGVQGIEEITSTSSEGLSRVRTSFIWGTNLDEASNDIRDRIDRILGRLPDDVERPMIRKFDLSAFPIMMLGVGSDLDPAEVRLLIEDQIQYRLERVDGVASVDIRGGREKQIQVSLRRAALDALEISPEMVIQTLLRENRNVPAGTVDRGNKEIIVRTFAEFEDLEDVRNAIIAVRNGVAVTVGEIADVAEGLEEITRVVHIGGKPGVQLAISKQSGANTVAVADAVRRELRAINSDFPQLEIIPRVDTSLYIRQSINAVGVALIMGGIIAILILLLFLRNISSTLIIAVTIPVSIIATFSLMYFGGLTLNMMTFGGLALGIGMLVDNAIVVLDSIFHHREQNGTPVESAMRGVSEVASAVTASTLTTLVVFFPVIFIRGMSGIMFRQLAFVVSFSLACSLITALTLVPMLTSRFLRFSSSRKNSGKGRGLFASSERVYLAIESSYGNMVTWALRHRKTVLSVTCALFAGAIAMLPLVGVELMPSADEGEVRVDVEMEVGTRLELVDSVVSSIESIVNKIPEVDFIISDAGGSWRSGKHTGSIRATLVPKGQRSRSSAHVANELRKELAGLPGTTIRVREGQGLFILRMGSGNDAQEVEIEIRGHDLDLGQSLAGQISKIVGEIDSVTDVEISRKEGMPEFDLRIDRKKAADLGLSALQIGSAIETAIGGTQASTLRRGGKEYPIVVRFAEEDRSRIENLSNMKIVNNSGAAIPFHAFATILEGEGPLQIERRDRERIITIQASYSGRDLGSVVSDIRGAIRKISLPPDFAVIIRGDYEEQQKAFRELMVGLILAVVLVYLVMAGQFESFKDPFIVLFSIPVALIGVVGLLFMTSTPFSVQAYIGCIILAGIVVNNAIVLIDYINRLRRERGYELSKAIRDAGVRRLRPIMMTALTTILGLLPLALGMGEGGEAQAPMARVVIGGLLTSTLITLLLIPVVYSIVEERRIRKKQQIRGSAKPLAPALLFAALLAIPYSSAEAVISDTGSDTLRMSLQDLLSQASLNNPLIRIEKIDVDIAHTIVREQRFAFEPRLSAQAAQYRDVTEAHPEKKPAYEGSVTLTEDLPFGTEIQFRSGMGKTSRSVSLFRDPEYQRTFDLTVTQALLSGGGLKANLAPLRAASLDTDIEREELAGYAQSLLAQTERAYWNLYLAGQEIAIHRRSLQLTGRLLFESQQRLNVGRIAPLDLVPVKAEAATREKNLIDAETDYLRCLHQLSYLVNSDRIPFDGKPIVLTDAPPQPERFDSLELHIETALKYRPDLRQARHLEKKGELFVATTRNGLLPKLDAFITLSGTAYSKSFGDEEAENEKLLSAGLRLSIPLTNGAARSRYRRAVLSKEKSKLSIENLSDLIRLDVRTAWAEIQRTTQLIGAARTARELQEQKCAAEQAKLEAGKSTEYLVLQTQRDLIASQLDEARAKVAYINSVTDLYLKEGTLLERRGVRSD